MRRLAIITIALAVTAIRSVAANVTTEAGSLSGNVADASTETTLVVSGSVDVRDLLFVATSMPALEVLDLSDAQIAAYHASVPVVGTLTDFPANEVPAQSLMGAVSLQRVVLPSTVTAIGDAAFAGCSSLSEVVLPQGLSTIGAYAFSATALTEVTVPAALTIGEGAYSRCPLLTTATVLATDVSDRAFAGCPLLATLTLGEGVQRIGVGAFAGCESLTTVDLPDGVTTVDAEAFVRSGVEQFDGSATELLSLGAWSLASTPLQTALLPSATATLGEGALFGTPALTDFAVPAALTTLPAYALAGSRLDADALPDGLTELGPYALYRATVPATLTLPAGVAWLGDRSMAYVDGLATLRVLAHDVPELGEQVWYGISQPAVNLDVADDIADTYAAAEQWQDFHILRTYLMGDVNVDRDIDITDVALSVGGVIDVTAPSFHAEFADMNNDGLLDVTDVTMIVDCVLSDRRIVTRRVRRADQPSSSQTSDCVGVNDLCIRSGEVAVLEVTLDNVRTDYTGFECSVLLPKGLRLADNEVELTDRSLRHVAAVRGYDNYVRLVSYSMGLSPFGGTQGTVLRLHVVADGEVDPYAEIEVSDVVFVTCDFERIEGSGSFARLTDATGVDNLLASGGVARVSGGKGEIVVETAEALQADVVAVNGVARRVGLAAGRNVLPVPAGIYVLSVAGKGHKVVVR